MTTSTSPDSLPLRSAEKPETTNTTVGKPEKSRIETKAPIINPAWAEEVAAKFDLSGDLAKRVARELATSLSSAGAIAKLTSRAKLAKAVRAAVNATIA